jgi:hypothetical protein
MNQEGNKCAVNIINKRQQLVFVFQFEIFVFAQKFFDDFRIFLRL